MRPTSGQRDAEPRTAAEDLEPGTEPDPRFTMANERTFLAWNRTALALVVAGLAIVQVLPPFAGIWWGRHLLGVPLILLGAVLAVGGYLDWTRDQRALRLRRPLPRTILPRIVALTIAAECVLAAVLVILAGGASP